MAVDVPRPGAVVGMWQVSCDHPMCTTYFDAAFGLQDDATRAKALDRARMMHWTVVDDGDLAYCPEHKPQPKGDPA